MKKILMCLDSFEVGGVTAVVKKLYDEIDRNRYRVDFIVMRRVGNDTEKHMRETGAKIYFAEYKSLGSVPVLNYIIQEMQMAKQLVKLIGKESYDCVHIHAHCNIYLRFAKLKKIPVRIMCAHEAVSDFGDNIYKSKLTELAWRRRQRIYNSIPTVRSGDSLRACLAKYGDKADTDRFTVIYPPVDLEKFNPDLYEKSEAVNKLGINTEEFNLIHIGRMTPVKNQKFIIDILFEINKNISASLYIVGDGPLKDEIKAYAKSIGMEKHLHILPPDTSPCIYKAVDCSVFPSLSEAFGMAAVESQIMGVPCFASDNVPEDVNMGMCTFLGLDEGAEEWANRILSYDYNLGSVDKNKTEKVKISCIAKRVEELYEGKTKV